MAASNRRRSVRADDPLRVKLDKLAERAVDRVLAKGNEATLREITETLKTVSAYRASTQTGGTPAAPQSSWEKYHQAINGTGAGNGAAH